LDKVTGLLFNKITSTRLHVKKVQELLGHSSIALTLDTYSHIIPSMHLEIAEKMDEVFK